MFGLLFQDYYHALAELEYLKLNELNMSVVFV